MAKPVLDKRLNGCCAVSMIFDEVGSTVLFEFSLSLSPSLPAYRPIHRIYIEYRYKDINIEHRYTFLYSGWDANRISIRVGKQTAGQRCCLSLPRLSSSTKLRRSAKRFVAFIATRKVCPSRAKLSKLLNSCEKTQFIYLVNNLSFSPQDFRILL